MDGSFVLYRRVYYVELASQLRSLAHQALFAAARSELIRLAKRFDSVSVGRQADASAPGGPFAEDECVSVTASPS